MSQGRMNCFDSDWIAQNCWSINQNYRNSHINKFILFTQKPAPPHHIRMSDTHCNNKRMEKLLLSSSFFLVYFLGKKGKSSRVYNAFCCCSLFFVIILSLFLNFPLRNKKKKFWTKNIKKLKYSMRKLWDIFPRYRREPENVIQCVIEWVVFWGTGWECGLRFVAIH